MKRINILSIILIIILLILLVLSIDAILKIRRTQTTNGDEISNFQECAVAGNPVMESYPRQCRDSVSGKTFVEEIFEEIECTPEQRKIEVCTALYQPVCAKVNVQCFTTPCDPVKETYSNFCEACANQLVSSYTIGEC